MPEHFDISLITRKSNISNQEMRDFLNDYGVLEGENEAGVFNKRLILSSFEEEDSDFTEIVLSFPEQVFHRDRFKDELEVYTTFINRCFECLTNLEYALCSYELNGYLIGNIKYIAQFNNDLLNRFPISYKRDISQEFPLLLLNLDAQEIFIN